MVNEPPLPQGSAGEARPPNRISLRRAFLTGFAALMPTALTVVILVWIFHFVNKYVAQPINGFIITVLDLFVEGGRTAAGELFRAEKGRGLVNFEFTGFVVAIAVIFFVGLVLLTFFGRRLHRAVDRGLSRLPVLRMIYPHVRQLTEFIFAENRVSAFRRVVMVEYPRKGLWSLGFVTGPCLEALRRGTGRELVSVFIPSSPTPFTGYVVAVSQEELIDLPITVDEALRFTISGGVIVPPRQMPAPPRGLVPGSSEAAGPARTTEGGLAPGSSEAAGPARTTEGGLAPGSSEVAGPTETTED